jgi:hypothetical protein
LKVEYRKRFLKDLSRVPSEVRKEIERFVFNEFPQMKSIPESGKIEQMKGLLAIIKRVPKLIMVVPVRHDEGHTPALGMPDQCETVRSCIGSNSRLVGWC